MQLRFGPFEVDLELAELRKRGRKVPLQDQPFKVLVLLLQRPGGLVTREELQRALWPGDTFGEFDEGLNKAIQKLRQALDDSTDSPKFIETLPRKGYRFIGELEAPTERPATKPEPVQEVRPRRSGREILAWALVAILMLALLAAVAMRPQPGEVHPVRFQVPPPEKVMPYPNGRPVVSPDGRYLAFRATNPDGKRHLWIHSLDSLANRLLPETETDDDVPFRPFWSPDSRSVGIFQGGKLKKIDIAGGPSRVICDAPYPLTFGASWSQNGAILFADVEGSLRRVSSAGGEPTEVLARDKSRNEISQMWPHFLPDGRHFLYFSESGDAARSGIYLASLDSKETRRLLSAESNVEYTSPGYLIYGERDALVAQPFDAGRLQLTGDPIPLAERAGRMGGHGFVFSISQNGVLAYLAPASKNTQLAWYNRGGKRLESVGVPGSYGQIALSPDEKRLAVEVWDTSNIWLLELSSRILSRLTFTEEDSDPIWSPDGHEMIFRSHRGNRWGLYRKVLGGDMETQVFDSTEELYSENWLSDGKSIVMIDQGGKTFYRVPLLGDPKPVALMKSEFGKDEPHVSPDQHWIAYNSEESGRWEVYVAAFPGFSGNRQVSSNGGAQALWRKDGKEIFYLSLDGKLMVVDVKAGATIETGMPKALFQTPLVVFPRDDQYCVTADGLRFLFAEPLPDSAIPITVVLNSTAGLKR